MHRRLVTTGGLEPTRQRVREATPHDRKALRGVLIVLGVLVLTMILSLPSHKDRSLFVMGYVVAIVYTLRGPLRHSRPWSEAGLKWGFREDLGKVWYLAGGVLLVQFIPLAIAKAAGFYPALLQHINNRASAIPGLLAAALILTLLEELVFRVTIQERLSWFIGTPLAILMAATLFGLVHEIGASGAFSVKATDWLGVALDGVFFGLIYAKTKNLPLTWATHYAVDVVAIIALTTIF